ncbi:MAG: methionyl-tRNA formyltransferase [Actinomycetota bacterium]
MFFGTPAWAVPSLDALLASDIEVAAVVTNPDRPAGRNLKTRPAPVKVAALEAGLEVLQPESARDPDLHDELQALAPDVATVVAYGKILPGALLRVPDLGFVNLHFSLLPAYRGAAPVARCLMDGCTETGVSVMVLTEGMDEGPVLATRAVPVAPDDTAGELGERLAHLGAPLLVETLAGYAEGGLVPIEQDHARATYAPKISSEERRIDWSQPAERIADLVRALEPAPGAWTSLRGGRVRIARAAAEPDGGRLVPGEIDATSGLRVGTGRGVLRVLEVQPAGRRRMGGDEAARGLRPTPGERFD